VCGAALIPMVTLGIPGALSVAVIMGAFMIHGLAPGPMLMVEHPETIYGMFMILIISDFFMLVIPLPLMKLGQKVIMVPRSYLFPIILILCCVGAYGTNQSLFDVEDVGGGSPYFHHTPNSASFPDIDRSHHRLDGVETKTESTG
jgi:putative tricarboxylic transport membrane protein